MIVLRFGFSAALAQKDHQPLPRMPIFSAQPISSSSANARVSESYNISSDLDIMVTDLDSSGGRHQDNNHSLREALESWAALDISGVHEAVSHAEERTQQSISELRDHAKSVLMATEIEERLLRTRLEALKSTLLQSTSTIWEDARYSQLARENGNRLNGNVRKFSNYSSAKYWHLFINRATDLVACFNWGGEKGLKYFKIFLNEHLSFGRTNVFKASPNRTCMDNPKV